MLPQFMRIIDKISTDVNPNLDIRQLYIFLVIADNPGISQYEVALRLHIPEGTVSRHISKLSSKITTNAKGHMSDTGYGLVVKNPEGHQNSCFLSEKGKKLINDISKITKG